MLSRIATAILCENRQIVRRMYTLTLFAPPLSLGRALSMKGPATSSINTAPSIMLVSPKLVSGEMTFFPLFMMILLQV